MALNNPDTLIPLLEDLSQKIRSFNHWVSYTLDDGEQLKNISADQAIQASFDTNHTANVKTDDENTIQYWDNHVSDMSDKLGRLSAATNETEGKLKRLLSSCNQSINHWNGQLHIANENLTKWTNYRNKAIQAMDAATANYNRAAAAYNSASNGYYNCMNARDSQGKPLNRNCSGYSSQMSVASNQMAQAKRDYSYWEQEKAKGESNIRQWETRITKCKDSLNKLGQAQTNTNEGIQCILEAANFGQRCLEEINSAKALVTNLKSKNKEQEVLVSQNQANMQNAERLSDDSKNAFIFAIKLATQVQYYGNCGGDEITKRADLLKEFSINPNL